MTVATPSQTPAHSSNATAAFEAFASRAEPEAWARFQELGLPTARHENWKYTDFRALRRERVVPAEALSDSAATKIQQQLNAMITAPNALRLVFVDGVVHEGLSNRSAWPKALSLDVAHDHPTVASASDPFVVLNAALGLETATVHVAAGESVKAPLAVVYITSPQGSDLVAGSFPRLHVSVEPGSSLTLASMIVGQSSQTHVAAIHETILLAKGASLEQTVQSIETSSSYVVHNRQIEQSADSTFRAAGYRIGGPVARDTCTVRLHEPHAEAHLQGLTMLDDGRQADTHIVIHHDAPHCQSSQNFRGVLARKAESGFTGRVIVKQDAQKTAAEQSNRNLLLTDDTSAHTRPQLEIYADDVRCTHGATIGQLDDDALFYLRARGVGEQQARALLIEAFGGDVLSSTSTPFVLEAMQAEIHKYVMKAALASKEATS